MSYTQPTDEMISEARRANLCDYFRSKGYDVEQRRDELHVKGFGGLYINTETNEWYCFSQADKYGGRNAVNCLTEILGMDFKTGVLILSSYSYEPTTPAPKMRELVIPERVENMRNVFAYLCRTRKIDSNIVSDLAHNGLLYQDKHGNAVFLHKGDNGEILGAELQGTNTLKLKSMSDYLPTLKSDIVQLRHFFSAGANSKRLDAMEQVKLAATGVRLTAREIADKYNVKSTEDIAALEKRLKSLQNEVRSIKAELSDEQLKLKRVSELITAYEKIVEGNYIDNLIGARREQNKTLDYHLIKC